MYRSLSLTSCTCLKWAAFLLHVVVTLQARDPRRWNFIRIIESETTVYSNYFPTTSYLMLVHYLVLAWYQVSLCSDVLVHL